MAAARCVKDTVPTLRERRACPAVLMILSATSPNLECCGCSHGTARRRRAAGAQRVRQRAADMATSASHQAATPHPASLTAAALLDLSLPHSSCSSQHHQPWPACLTAHIDLYYLPSHGACLLGQLSCSHPVRAAVQRLARDRGPPVASLVPFCRSSL
jgi:hypothetical protein